MLIPVYNEQGNLSELYSRLSSVLDTLTNSWEVVLVDDGSDDETWRRLRALHLRDARVRGVRLSRNFGHQYALLACLNEAAGDAVITMDGDLQHPPEIIPSMVEEWFEGSKIVKTVRVNSEHTCVLSS